MVGRIRGAGADAERLGESRGVVTCAAACIEGDQGAVVVDREGRADGGALRSDPGREDVVEAAILEDLAAGGADAGAATGGEYAEEDIVERDGNVDTPCALNVYQELCYATTRSGTAAIDCPGACEYIWDVLTEESVANTIVDDDLAVDHAGRIVQNPKIQRHKVRGILRARVRIALAQGERLRSYVPSFHASDGHWSTHRK